MRKRTSPIWIISKEDLTKIVKNNDTLSGILRELKRDPSNSGGRFRSLKKRLNEDNIDYSHIKLGNFANKGKKFPSKAIPLEEVMVENSTYSRKTLKKRLLKNGMLKNECSICGQEPIYNGKKLVMVLDHINGVRNDNREENLRLLCPNCNSQQNTFAGRNNKKPLPKCKNCGKEVSRRSKTGFCKDCYVLFYVSMNIKNRPSKEQLLKEIEETNYCAVGRTYGVTDTAIRKWLKTYEKYDNLDIFPEL